MADVIKEFLVSLGVKVDEAGMRRFDGALKTLTSTTKGFVISFVGMVTTIEESLRRVGRSYEQLFYLSQQTGVSASNLKSLEFGFKQIGISADQFHAAITQINREFVSSPGMKYFVANLVPGFNAATGTATDALIGFAEEYRKRMAMGEAAAAQYYNAISDITDAELVRHTAQRGNLEELRKGQEEAAKIYRLYNFNADDAAKKSAQSMRQWNAVWDVVKLGFDKLTLTVLNSDGFQNLLKRFLEWMEHDGIRIINDWIKRIQAWLDNPKNVEDWICKFENIGNILIKLAGYVGDLITAFEWLSKKIGPLEALAVSVATIWLAKLALMEAAAWAFGKALHWAFGARMAAGAATGAAAQAAGGAATGAFPGLVPIAVVGGLVASAIAATRANFGLKTEGVDEALESTEGIMETLLGWFGIKKGAPGVGATKEQKERLERAFRPHSYGESPIPAFGENNEGTNYAELMFFGFQHWWAGSGAFRPYVAFAEEVYTKLADMIRDVLGLNVAEGGPGSDRPGGGEQPGGGGPGGGKGEGPGPAPNIDKANVRNQAIDYFVSKGWTREQAAGIASSLERESQWNPNAKGDSGKAFGIGQWHPDRQAKFKEQFGKDIREASIGEQLAFVDWELKHTESGAGERLRGAKTAREAGARVSEFYERPKDREGEKTYRGNLAEEIYRGYQPSNLAGGETGGPGSTGRAGAAPEQRGTRYGALGGGGDIKNLNTEFRENLNKAVKAAYEATGETINIISGYRSHEHQKQLHAASGGSGMVGKPGGSRHEYGIAADLDQRQARALAWLHQNADKFNLHFPLTGSGGTPREPWHIEPQWSRGGDWRGRSQRTNNVQAENNVEIHVHGVTDPHSAAEAAVKLQDRHAALNNATLEKMMT